MYNKLSDILPNFQACLLLKHTSEKSPMKYENVDIAGQACAKQGCEDVGFTPVHIVSDTVAPVAISWHTTIRVCVPSPQVTEHAPYVPVAYLKLQIQYKCMKT